MQSKELMQNEAYVRRIAELATVRDDALAEEQKNNDFLLRAAWDAYTKKMAEIRVMHRNRVAQIFSDFERHQEAVTLYAQGLLARGSVLPDKFW